MEFSTIGTLAENIKLQRQIGTYYPEYILRKWLSNILCALLFIQNCKNGIHRDIKPANILIFGDE